jgi:hypothetical protein
MQKLGKHPLRQDTLEQLVRLEAGRASAGMLTNLGRVAALTGTLLGGIAIAASFLAPGLALAGSMPTAATGAHPWIVDGGGEVADNLSWRLEITVEYIAIGVALIFVTLRFGKVWLAKLQDWYEAAPAPVLPRAEAEAEAVPAISQFPAPLRRPIPRTKGHGKSRDGRHELHAA